MNNYMHDVRELMALAEAANPNDPRLLSAFSDEIRRCQEMGIRAYIHIGKMLVRAQEVFYANHSEGEADKLYGQWRNENTNITKEMAQRHVAAFRYADQYLGGNTTVSPLALKVSKLLMSPATPEKVRKDVAARIKNGETVIERDVRLLACTGSRPDRGAGAARGRKKRVVTNRKDTSAIAASLIDAVGKSLAKRAERKQLDNDMEFMNNRFDVGLSDEDGMLVPEAVDECIEQMLSAVMAVSMDDRVRAVAVRHIAGVFYKTLDRQIKLGEIAEGRRANP